jgi:hypothetical protein
LYICDVHLVFRSCGLNTKYSRKLESPTLLRNRVWAFLSVMETDKEIITSMTKLHADSHLAIIKLKKIHAEIELSEYEKVLKFAEPDMPAFDKLIDIVEDILLKISNCNREIKRMAEWRR